MNAVEYFVDFYSNLTTPGMLLFWSIITLFLFLIFSVIALLIKNNNLINYINNQQKEDIELDIPKNNLTIQQVEEEETDDKFSLEGSEPIQFNTVKEALKATSINNANAENSNDLYKKNILNEVGTKNQTSPINISKQNLTENIERLQKTMAMPLNLEPETEDANFIDTISMEVENQIDSKPIELSDYETKQEEEAIISYEELKKNAKLAETREERYKIDIEDDNDFLNELKSFKNNLE